VIRIVQLNDKSVVKIFYRQTSNEKYGEFFRITFTITPLLAANTREKQPYLNIDFDTEDLAIQFVDRLIEGLEDVLDARSRGLA
jgi:hypothetical protein